MHVAYACRSCPYDQGKGKRTFTLDHEGKCKRTLNLQGEDRRQFCGRGMAVWLPCDEVEPPPGIENERVWPPPALVDAWIRKGKGLGKGLGKERAIDVWIGKGPGKDKGKGNAWNNEVLLGHVWDLVDAVVGKGNGKGKEEDMSDAERNAWMEQRKGKGYVWP